MINIALYQPDIPQNTAAIIRTCSCLNIRLEIIKPTGFILNEKKLDRVYLDYLENCKIIYHESFEEFFETKNHENIILFTTKSKNRYYNHKFKKEDTLLFGMLPEGVVPTIKDRDFTIATVAAPTVVKEPEPTAETEAASTTEGGDEAKTDDTKTDGADKASNDKEKKESADKK